MASGARSAPPQFSPEGAKYYSPGQAGTPAPPWVLEGRNPWQVVREARRRSSAPKGRNTIAQGKPVLRRRPGFWNEGTHGKWCAKRAAAVQPRRGEIL